MYVYLYSWLLKIASDIQDVNKCTIHTLLTEHAPGRIGKCNRGILISLFLIDIFCNVTIVIVDYC